MENKSVMRCFTEAIFDWMLGSVILSEYVMNKWMLECCERV